MTWMFELICQSNRVDITTLADQIDGEHRSSQGTAPLPAGKRMAGSRNHWFETQILFSWHKARRELLPEASLTSPGTNVPAQPQTPTPLACFGLCLAANGAPSTGKRSGD